MVATTETDSSTARPAMQDRPASALPGWPVVLVGALAAVVGILLVVWGCVRPDALGATLIVIGALALAVAVGVYYGLVPVAPGEARVVQLFGRYTGTITTPGLQFVNPLSVRRKLSTRIRNHETSILKVNDADGNPIDIGAVVVWHVHDPARAVYAVDDFVRFVGIQTDTAVRHIANSYPYGARTADRLSLLDDTEEITGRLSREIAERVAAAGVTIVESRISQLAYSPEIAQAMLRQQQASAVVAARRQIVDGAVGMVRLALARLDEEDVVELDEERKATMVSNLLVVLCSDQATQPVVNTGSLYQ